MPDDRLTSVSDESELDCTGLKCPLPVLKARRAMRNLAAGQTLSVIVTDPKAPEDFEHFAETTGHKLLSCRPTGEGHVIRLEKV